jgi:hypothetical protein
MLSGRRRLARTIVVAITLAASANIGWGAAADARSERHFTAQLGFGHWYGEAFGAPAGIKTPAAGLGMRVNSWLETRLRYCVSLVELDLPSGGRSQVGYATLAALAFRELRVGGQRMRLGCGPQLGAVHSRGGLGFVYGVCFASRYLVAVGRLLSLGPFIDVQALQYRLALGPGEKFDARSEVQVDLGLAIGFK